MELLPRQEPQINRLIFGLLIFGSVTAAVSLIHKANLSPATVLIPALWGLGALLPGWRGDFPPPVLGLTRPFLPKGLKLFILSSAIVFPLYAMGFYTARHLGFFVPSGTVLTNMPLLKIFFYNLIMVAFFEELFFRGYLFDRFEEASRQIVKESRLTFWLPVTATAFLFGAAHVAADLDPARMAVFFPALLFGWLRAKTGSLVAPVLSHATANAIFHLLIG